MIDISKYNFPDNWYLTTINEIFKNLSLTNIKIKKKDYLDYGNIPVIDQGCDLIGGYTNNKETIVKCKLPVIIFGDHTKIIKYIDFEFSPGADGIKVLQTNFPLNVKLLYYFLQIIVQNIPDKGYARHYQYMVKSPIPLPPLPEQHRIVAKIDELFSELNAGVAALKKAKSMLETYKQAVLKAAFEGKSKIDNNEWRSYKLSEISRRITDGEHFRPKTINSGVYFLSAKDVRDHDVIFDNPLYVSEKDAIKFRQRCNPEKDDILMVSRGATVGRTCTIKNDKLFCLLGSVILIKVNRDKVYPTFLEHYLKSPNIQKILIELSGSTAQQAIYLRDIKNIDVPLPSLDTQIKIVNEIQYRLSYVNELINIVDNILYITKITKQSVLKKAFSGRLVPQNPYDEPAEKLLERIKRSIN